MRNWLAQGVAAMAVALPMSTIGSTSVLAQSRSLWLYNGNVETISGYFLAGEVIEGWCDQDCYDLDLVLLDTSGRVVSEDRLTDSIPIVTAPYTGDFRIRVIMHNCSHSAGCAAWVDSTYGF